MKHVLALAAVFWMAAQGLAAEPRLSAYVTDQDEDIFVALYDGVAIELSGCPDKATARALLQLPSGAPLIETTFDSLTADSELGQHPGLPCGSDAAFDADLPATTPIWADLGRTERYYLAAPDGAGRYYSVPLACDAIKDALAVRQRIQLPGVLRGQSAPPDLSTEVLLDCGSVPPGETGTIDTGPDAAAEWSLHRVDTFLSADSVGDSIYVARFFGSRSQSPVFLPIWRVNGVPANDAIWNGGALTVRVEADLRALFGLPPTAEITPLGFEALAALQSAVYLDLCLFGCEGYEHRHAFFAAPGIDLDLTPLPPAIGRAAVNLLGRSEIVWDYANDRALILAGCDRLSAALGLTATETPEWADAVEAALGVAADAAPDRVACGGAANETCRRQIADGGTLSPADLLAQTACPDARRLVLELGAGVSVSGALVLTAGHFKEAEIRPAPGVARSTLRVIPSTPALPASACLFSPAPALIAVNGTRLTLRRIDLVRAESTETGEVAAIQVEGDALALDETAIGAAGEGRRPVERALRICNAELYAAGGSVAASALALQAVASRILMTGSGTAPLAARGDRFGMLLATGSLVRLHRVSVASANPIVLRDAALTGSRVDLAPGGVGAAGDALRLERGAAAKFTQSGAAGFRCVGVFFDAASAAEFVLPANDLASDNGRLSCGNGAVEILE